MLKITVQVDGMMCGMCESHVNPKECRQTRLDIDPKLSQAVAEWGKGEMV